MRALSIRQPYAELILRGIKTAELRSRPTRIIGQRFHIYASLKRASVEDWRVWSRDLTMPDDRLPGWMLELAEQMKLIPPGLELPTGVIVGSAVIERVDPPDPADGDAGLFRWQLTGVRRFKRHLTPERHAQPTWFEPFDVKR
jgi:hypothetical protein